MRGVFITATGTCTGKTIFGLLLGLYLRKKKIPFKVVKPFETGCLEKKGDLIPMDGLLYKFVLELDEPLEKIVPFRFSKPLAPYQASIIDNKPLNFASVISKLSKGCDDDGSFYIFEGAGGLFVPVEEDIFVVDLIKALKLPAVVISNNRLGTINHTLLTVETLKSKQIEISGVILNNLCKDHEISQDLNPDYFSRIFGTLYLGNIPFIEELAEAEKKLHMIVNKKLKVGVKEMAVIRMLLSDIYEKFISMDMLKLF